MCSVPGHMVSNLLSCCHQGWLVLLVQRGLPFPGSIRSTVFTLCCTDVAILPHIFQMALLVRYSTKTLFYHLEFLSTSLTLYFRGQLCFAQVSLTPHIECLCAFILFSLKVLLGVIGSLTPIFSNTRMFVFVTVNACHCMLFLVQGGFLVLLFDELFF